MRNISVIVVIVGVLAIASCQPAVPTLSGAEIAGTNAQATGIVDTAQAETAAAVQAANQTMTAAAPTPTATPSPVPTVNRTHVNIAASACWVDTGIKITSGQAITIAASGQANTWGGRDISNGGPDGQRKNMCGDISCPLIGSNYGALIGRIGEGKTFEIGSSLQFTAAEDGNLFMTINDWQCEDNSGNFTVTVTID